MCRERTASAEWCDGMDRFRLPADKDEEDEEDEAADDDDGARAADELDETNGSLEWTESRRAEKLSAAQRKDDVATAEDEAAAW